MYSIILATWLTTVVPPRDDYYCKLQRIERDLLCVYWCGYRSWGFSWFEKQGKDGCKIRKKFYIT